MPFFHPIVEAFEPCVPSTPFQETGLVISIKRGPGTDPCYKDVYYQVLKEYIHVDIPSKALAAMIFDRLSQQGRNYIESEAAEGEKEVYKAKCIINSIDNRIRKEGAKWMKELRQAIAHANNQVVNTAATTTIITNNNTGSGSMIVGNNVMMNQMVAVVSPPTRMQPGHIAMNESPLSEGDDTFLPLKRAMSEPTDPRIIHQRPRSTSYNQSELGISTMHIRGAHQARTGGRAVKSNDSIETFTVSQVEVNVHDFQTTITNLSPLPL